MTTENANTGAAGTGNTSTGTGGNTGGAGTTNNNSGTSTSNTGGAGEGTGQGSSTIVNIVDGNANGVSGAGGTGTGQGEGQGTGTGTGEGNTGQGNTPPADWPADWRTKGMAQAGIAADDAKVKALLDRFTSPADLIKKVVEQDKLIAQGKHKGVFPKEGTPEQQAAWRKENGVPDGADKYDLTLKDGLVVGEEDKAIVGEMLKTMHGHNLSNDTVKDIMAAYYQQEKQFLAARSNDIAQKKQEMDDALHAEWGNEYRPNLNAFGALAKTWSQETRSALAGATDSDGYPLLNNKSFLKDMALMARTINPIDHVPGLGSGSQSDSVDDEIKKIEARMGGIDPTYYKDTKAQARYLQLIEWREKQKKVS